MMDGSNRGNAMIVDIRIYTCHPHKAHEWLALYKEVAWPLQKKYLGRCKGWYTTVEGQLNTVIHLWEYDSQADREARRGAMAKDPEWQAFLAKGRAIGALISQENRILAPTDFYLADG
jgi:hypothetical protein